MKKILKSLSLSLMVAFLIATLAFADETDIIGINDTLVTPNFDFSIISAETCTDFENQLGVEYTAESGNEFLIIVFSATNTSDEESNAMYSGFDSYVDDVKTNVSSVLGEINGYMPLIGGVAPGKTFEGYAVWELPEDWGKLEFYYMDSGFGGISDDMFTIYATDIDNNAE